MLPNRNSLIIADNYCLDKPDLYQHNIFEMIHALLPAQLSNDECFHISFITRPDLPAPEKKLDTINTFIETLNKSYDCKVGLFLTQTNEPHDRDVVSNYFRMKVGYSFDFLNSNGRPKKDTELTLTRIASEDSASTHFNLIESLAEYTRHARHAHGFTENRLLTYFS